MFPTTTYFGCFYRYRELGLRKKRKAFRRSSLTCAFATKGSEKDREPQEGNLTFESCKEAVPEGDLRQTSELPICVGESLYLKVIWWKLILSF